MAEPRPPTDQRGAQAGTVLIVAVLAGAAMLAIIGTLLPAWIGITGTPAILMSLAFYAIAVVDVAIALWLRARLKSTRQSSGGPVQRQ